ncbi:cysteine-rich secretory protein family protein [Nitzschia inconspicua]|uniref:Cysteine-rich secretory protein family protein n=1 Tax=Nitzschia inconspicua TaxID=303405 RepID=A0A9K3K5T5_9STRA|nr:cysteine-rich secretory protein family protein [Nitzschia inconspicua]KAG7358863.1 cysteine-rich secretory protein family protein [Nitzschia inconspicua]
MATTKSQSLFRRVFPTRRSHYDNTRPSNFETIGGVYQEPSRKGFHHEVLIVREERTAGDLGKQLKSLNDNATAATEPLSSASSFDDSLSGNESSSARSSRYPSPYLNMELRRQPSQRNLFSNMDFHSLDNDVEGDEESVSSDPVVECVTADASAWISSGDSRHHDGAPLITLRSESVRLIDPKRPELQLGDDEVLHKVLTKASKHLPRHSGNFASLHVMINSERLRNKIAPLQRMVALDEMARQHAVEMANQLCLRHASLHDLQKSLYHQQPQAAPSRIGSNVASCNDGDAACLFSFMMKECVADRNNILDRRYTYMGVGTCKSQHDGKLYVCQLFV